MKLISAVNEYRAVNLIKRNARYSIYKCVSREGRGYLLYKFAKDETPEAALVARFNDMPPDFDGFSELFADSDESLVLVFKDNTLEQTAADYMSGDTSETAKLRFFERMLEALCVHEIPPNIACDLLENDNIGVKSDGSADCRYILNNITAFEDRNMAALSKIFAKKLTQVLSFSGRIPEVEKFCGELKADPPETVTGLYDRYVSFVEARENSKSPNSSKNKLKKAANIGKAALTAAVLVMTAIILIMSFFENDTKKTKKFDQIGEVLIEEPLQVSE